MEQCRLAEDELISPYFLSGTKNLSLVRIRRYSLRACWFCFLSSLLQYRVYSHCIIGLLSLAYLQWILVALKKVPSFSGEKLLKPRKRGLKYFLSWLFYMFCLKSGSVWAPWMLASSSTELCVQSFDHRVLWSVLVTVFPPVKPPVWKIQMETFLLGRGAFP